MRLMATLLFAMGVVIAAIGGELDTAKAALRDGIWVTARKYAANDKSDEAKLVILESYAGEGRWNEVKSALDKWPECKGDAFDYYRAVVAGDHAAAMKILGRGSVEGHVVVRMHEAEALVKAGNRKDAMAIWREVVSMTNVNDEVFAVASMNLGEVNSLRKAYETVRNSSVRRQVGLRLGVVMMKAADTEKEGERLVRAIVKDYPDSIGAMDAFLCVADRELAAKEWQSALDTYRQAVEIWPDAIKSASVHDGLGWALFKLGDNENALSEFTQAESLAKTEEAKALAMVKIGDVLSELGRSDEAMAKYRFVLEKYPNVSIAEKLSKLVKTRELEASGRKLYKEFDFNAAIKVFAEVAQMDESRKPRMDFFKMLCQYGLGRDDSAKKSAIELMASCPDAAVRADVMFWYAKFCYNRGEWKEAMKTFTEYANIQGKHDDEAMLWSARAAFADNDFNLAILTVTRLVERHPDTNKKASALIVQGEALIELARFDEAVLVLERVLTTANSTHSDRVLAKMLRADALFAMGADNQIRYEAALEAYRSILIEDSVTEGMRLKLAFKVARTLEKLRRIDEAMDQYYSQVVLAYRDGRLRGVLYSDDESAMFSKAAFRLADEHERRGSEKQAISVLELLAKSDVPAADEALKRINRILNKGRFL